MRREQWESFKILQKSKWRSRYLHSSGEFWGLSHPSFSFCLLIHQNMKLMYFLYVGQCGVDMCVWGLALSFTLDEFTKLVNILFRETQVVVNELRN